MNKKIIFNNLDGSIGIIHPTQEAIKKYTIEQIADKDVPEGLEYNIVDESEIPTDRSFRNAWEYDASLSNKKVKVNINKAKEIAHIKRRSDRSEAFKPLDIKATIPSESTAAEASRQIIRDSDAQKQIDIDNAATPDEIKAIMDRKLP